MRSLILSVATVVLLAALAPPSTAQAGWTDLGLGHGLAGAYGVPQLDNAWGTLPVDVPYWIVDPASVQSWSASNALTTTTL